MKKNITINDVAARAGVSPATVSFVLSGKAKISNKVCEKVNEAVKSLGYVPRNGKNKTASERTVGIILDIDPLLPFVWSAYRAIVQQIKKKLRSLEINAIIIPIDSDSKEAEIRNIIIEHKFFAIISILYVNEELFNYLSSRNISIVVLMNDALQNKCHSVLVDDYQAVFDATSYLVNKGHKKMLYIDYERPDIPSLPVDRYNGFLKAINYYRLKYNPGDHITLKNTQINEVIKHLQPRIDKKEDRPTGIVALDDYLLISIYFALEKMGYRIPADFSLISVGNVLDYNLPYVPQLTTIKINNRLTGDLAVDLILNVHEHDVKLPQIVKVTCQINEGKSCREL